MCDTCGCNITEGNRHLIEGDGRLAQTESGREAITVLQGLLSENDREAAHNREHFDRHAVLALNLMSSPGSGKTRLLEETIAALGT
ncbi:MAG: hydrogenase accessory protein HypB, partial [Sedimenticolaceae bacterium]